MAGEGLLGGDGLLEGQEILLLVDERHLFGVIEGQWGAPRI